MNEEARRNRFYYKLFDRLDAFGCPICRIVIEDSRSYLDSVLYERITDVPTRLSLRESFGLCNLHTWQLRDLPGSSAPDLGFAIIAKDLLNRFQRMAGKFAADQRRTLAKWFVRTRSRLRAALKRTRCPACVHAARSESVHLQQLLTLLGDRDFARKFQDSSGICLPHFLQAEETHLHHAHFELLRTLEICNAHRLHDTLERFLEKHDHRAHEDVTPAEARSWMDAMDFLSGKRALFDSELHRPSPKRLAKLLRR